MGAGSSSVDSCLLRDPQDKDRSCGLSLCGEDAFFRDAFHDCEEGSSADDHHFGGLREQARLKLRKGNVILNYAKFEFKRASVEPVTQALKSCTALRDPKASGSEQSPRTATPKVSRTYDQCGSASWLGRTMPEWTQKEFPATGDGPWWSKGQGEGLKVRAGPDYKKHGRKTDSNGAMYTALSCDAIKSDKKVENIIHDLMHGELPGPPNDCTDGEQAGGSALQWTENCPLPRIICINMMMPYSVGYGLWGAKQDSGCSFVGIFHITPQTIQAAQSSTPPPHVRLLMDFWNGPAGLPESTDKDPNRSLHTRVDAKRKKDQQAGLFKAMARCVNPEDVSVPDIFHSYNGKPCLITKCGYVVKDPAGQWLELGIDVRGFNILARKMLCSYRTMLQQTKIHYGFLVQGVEDEDMPEGLLCDMFVHGVNILEDPVDLNDDFPRALRC